jgi:hypothetical protein
VFVSVSRRKQAFFELSFAADAWKVRDREDALASHALSWMVAAELSLRRATLIAQPMK